MTYCHRYGTTIAKVTRVKRMFVCKNGNDNEGGMTSKSGDKMGKLIAKNGNRGVKGDCHSAHLQLKGISVWIEDSHPTFDLRNLVFVKKAVTLMKPLGNLIGLTLGAQGWRVGCQITGGGNKEVDARCRLIYLPDLTTGRLNHLDGGEIAILTQEQASKLRQQGGNLTAGIEIVSHLLPGWVDLLLTVKQLGKVGEGCFIYALVAIGLRDACSGDVEKAVKVDAHGCIQHTAEEFGRGRAPQTLLNGVGKGEGM
jgi:hypothetical protein